MIKPRIAFPSAALSLWVASVVVKDVIRPSVSDPSPLLGLLLGSAPGFFSAMGIPFFFLACHRVLGARVIRKVMLWAFAIVTFAEWLEGYLDGSISDWHDWAASIIGVLIGGAVAKLILRTQSSLLPER